MSTCSNCGTVHGLAGECSCSSPITFPFYPGPQGFQGNQGWQGAVGPAGSAGDLGATGGDGPPGAGGAGADYLVLDAPVIVVPADSTGHVTDWTNGHTVARFFIDNTYEDISSGVGLSITPTSGAVIAYTTSSEGPGLYGRYIEFTNSQDTIDPIPFRVVYTYGGATYPYIGWVVKNVAGATGAQGFQGRQGWQGVQGASGTNGITGVQGSSGGGPQGAQGRQGPAAPGSSFIERIVTLTEQILKYSINAGVDVTDDVVDTSDYIDLISIVARNKISGNPYSGASGLGFRFDGESTNIAELTKDFVTSPSHRTDIVRIAGNLQDAISAKIIVIANNGNYSGAAALGEIYLSVVYRHVNFDI